MVKRRILTGLLPVAGMLCLVLSVQCTVREREYDVLVIGGGTSGTAAAIQAARSGADVLLVEEFGWLGGMLTSAGVSATDGCKETISSRISRM